MEVSHRNCPLLIICLSSVPCPVSRAVRNLGFVQILFYNLPSKHRYGDNWYGAYSSS